MSKIILSNFGSTPATPPSGYTVMYPDANGALTTVGADGSVIAVGSGRFVAGPEGSVATYQGTSAVVAAVAAASALIPGTISSAVVEILPGMYDGTMTIPANISLMAVGGYGSVTLNGPLLLPAISGTQVLQGLTYNGTITMNAGGDSSSANLTISDCYIQGDGPAVTTAGPAGQNIVVLNSELWAGEAPAAVIIDGTAGFSMYSTMSGDLWVTGYVYIYNSTIFGGILTGSGTEAYFVNSSMDGSYGEYALLIGISSDTTVRVQGTCSFRGTIPDTGTLWTGDGTFYSDPGTYLGSYAGAHLPLVSSNSNGSLVWVSDYGALANVVGGGWFPIGNNPLASVFYEKVPAYVGVAGPLASSFTTQDLSQIGTPLTLVASYDSGWQRDGAGSIVVHGMAMDGTTETETFTLAGITTPVVSTPDTAPWNFSGGNDVFTISILQTGGGSPTTTSYTLAHTPATLLGTNATWGPVTPGNQIVIQVVTDPGGTPGSNTHTIIFETESLESDYLTTLNTGLGGDATATDDGSGHILITSALSGSLSAMTVISGDTDVLAMLGYTASQSAVNPGPNDVADIAYATYSETSTAFNTAFSGNAVMATASSNVTITASMAGVVLTVTGTAAGVIGFATTPADGDPPQTILGVIPFLHLGTVTNSAGVGTGPSVTLTSGASIGVPRAPGWGALVYAVTVGGVDATASQGDGQIFNGTVTPTIAFDGTKGCRIEYQMAIYP